MSNLRGASPVGRGGGSRSYVARAVSRVNREMETLGRRGRRRKERVGVIRARGRAL